jgi:hypothetical protein
MTRRHENLLAALVKRRVRGPGGKLLVFRIQWLMCCLSRFDLYRCFSEIIARANGIPWANTHHVFVLLHVGERVYVFNGACTEEACAGADGYCIDPAHAVRALSPALASFEAQAAAGQ